MNEDRGNKPIAPILVAGKLDKIKNFEVERARLEMVDEPRFAEMLWFLQWISNTENYPGGLTRFAADFVSESRDFIGSTTMNEIGSQRAYTLEEEEQIEDEIEPYAMSTRHWAQMAELARSSRDESIEEESEAAPRRKKMGREYYIKDCIERAESGIAGYLLRLCEKSDVLFTQRFYSGHYADRISGEKAPGYFCRIGEAILAFMDRRKLRIASTIGETAVTKEVFKWLETARQAKRAVAIIGTERFGKSQAIKNWCEQNPGIVRLVQTPASNAEGDLLREVAKALGIHCGPAERGFKLREMIDYVLTHSGLMLVFDEAQFLIPANYSRNTAPARLNWLRRSVMDKGIACALVATPQSYKPAKDRFVKKTGFAIAQFDERILKTVQLPDELAPADLMSIARIHFPNLAEQYLNYIVEHTLATERNYVSDIEKIAALSHVNARQAGRKAPTLADIKTAIADVLPPADKAVPRLQKTDSSKPRAGGLQRRCNAPADTLQREREEDDFPSTNRVELHIAATG